MTPSRPVPVPDEGSAPFWEAARAGALALPRCSRCSALTLPPDSVCPHCGSPEPDWVFEAVSGRGTVRSWTTVHRAFLPGFDVPFVLVDVEIPEQADLRLVGRLLDGPDAPVELGAAVVTEFEEVATDVSIPVFRLEAGG